MPSIREYPTTIQPTHCLPEFPDFQVGRIVYEDNSVDYNLDQTTTQRRWTLEYNFLTEEEAATLDAHFGDAYGSASEFYFTDPWTEVRYHKVRYEHGEGYQVGDHVKKWSPKRRVVLIQELV